MKEQSDWRVNSKCLSLSPEQADALFFPGSGGKPHKAKAFCGTCEVQGKCLLWAIEKNMEGFFSGTTKEERKIMATLRNISVVDIEEEIISEGLVPIFTTPDPYEYLDRLEPTDEEIFGLEPVVRTVQKIVDFTIKTKKGTRQLVFS